MQLIGMRKKVLGDEHPDILSSMGNLASTYRNQGRWKEAETRQVQTMGIMKKVLGDKHPNTLPSMNNLAFTWKSQGNFKDANCLHLRQQILGPDHPVPSVLVLPKVAELKSSY
ncbi:kinesin light chain [Lasiosphaeria hispida]|uniref:Kinesin light chain n=1 Tax=Lasiosphaeria hispida TaxID=260671 RepID=A0AAJ0HDB5_9PEZI|nr:kinesin light chain [Lasiosphaeria hispida]